MADGASGLRLTASSRGAGCGCKLPASDLHELLGCLQLPGRTRAGREREHDRVIITRSGREAAVLISAADLAELEETLSVLSDAQRTDLLGERTEVGYAAPMTRVEAETRCAQLNADCDAADGRWLPQETAGHDWRVVKVRIPGAAGVRPLKATVEAKPRPHQAPDPRSSHFQNIPPYLGSG